jgi:hypothetical protein
MNEICSLCVVVNTKGGTTMLQRVADLENDKLIPYEQDKSREYDYDNIDRIALSWDSKREEGFVGLWSWKVLDKNLQKSSFTKKHWIEYLRLDNISTFADLRERLLCGIDGITTDHNYLFEFKVSNKNECSCAYIEAWEFFEEGQKAKLKNDVYFLKTCVVKTVDIGEIYNRSQKFSRSYYKRLIVKTDRNVPVYPPEVAVKKIIISQIRKYLLQGMTKSDRRVIVKFLDSIPNNRILEEILQKCGCDEQTARKNLEAFRNNCGVYFENEDFGMDVLQKVVENSSELGAKYKYLIREEWEKENNALLEQTKRELSRWNEQIDEAKKNLDEAKKNLDEQKKKFDEHEAVYSQLSQKKDALEKSIDELRQKHEQHLHTADNITEQVHQKLATAKDDIVNFFAEYALFAPVNVPNIVPAVESAVKTFVEIVHGEKITDTPYSLENIADLFDELTGNLKSAGIIEGRRKALAAYLIAAYAAKTPLILAGRNADAIADALAATLRNHTAARAYCFDKTDIAPLTECSGDDVVIVYDAFHGGVLSQLLSRPLDADAYFCFVALTEDELAMEPSGFYDYALPLFTRLFVDSLSEYLVEGAKCNFDMPDMGKTMPISLPRHAVSPFVFKNCKDLAFRAAGVYENLSEFDLFTLQTVPLMLALGRSEELLKIIESSSLSDDEKKELKIFLGEAL